MEYKSSEIKAGLFILVSLVLLFAFLLTIMGINRWGDKDIYRAHFEYIGGIEKGSLVRFGGLEVGRVEKVEFTGLDSAEIALVLEIEENTPVRKNSRAFLTTLGIMGAYYVEITPGSADAPLLPPGSVLETKDVPGFVQLTEPANQAMQQATDLIKSLNDVLNKENRQQIASMLKGMNQLVTQNTVQMNELMVNMNRLSRKLESSVDMANMIMARNDSTLHNNLLELEMTLAQTRSMAQSVNELVQELDHTVGTNREQWNQTMQGIRDITHHVNQLTESLKDRPWLLIRKEYPEPRTIE
jgi:phospholipid/cholesterol/gamma-HCH transport system substrate-binding protein